MPLETITLEHNKTKFCQYFSELSRGNECQGDWGRLSEELKDSNPPGPTLQPERLLVPSTWSLLPSLTQAAEPGGDCLLWSAGAPSSLVARSPLGVQGPPPPLLPPPAPWTGSSRHSCQGFG